jgi:hypothetical protein
MVQLLIRSEVIHSIRKAPLLHTQLCYLLLSTSILVNSLKQLKLWMELGMSQGSLQTGAKHNFTG